MRIILLSLLLLACGFSAHSGQPASVSKDTVLMGSSFTFTAVHESPETAWHAVVAGINEVERIEALISSWKLTSQTSAVNRFAGVRPVHVSAELIDLIERCQKISQLSDGYFDISFASIDKVWDFTNSSPELPDDSAIAASVATIDFRNVLVDREKQTVFLKENGMKIGFGAIGKGYAADRARAVMQSMGIESGVVNAGGDLLNWGQRPDGSNWTIGIADPEDKTNILSWLNVGDRAVATSGNYEKYLTINGERFCHIINPKTGWPVKGMQSATIIAPSGELADALATTVFVLGVDEGLRLINHLQGVEAILVDSDLNLHYSSNIEPNMVDAHEIDQ